LELEGKEETEKSRRTTFRNLYDSGDFYLLNHIRDYIKDGTSAERLHHLVKRSGRIALGIGVKDLNKEDFWERLQIAIKRIEKMREKYFHIIRKQRAVLEESL
jgi:hypothetical protein